MEVTLDKKESAKQLEEFFLFKGYGKDHVPFSFVQFALDLIDVTNI